MFLGTSQKFALIVVVLLFVVAAMGKEKAALVYPTPEAVNRAAHAAYERGDYSALIACYSPKGLDANVDLAMMFMVAHEMPSMTLEVTLKVGDQSSTTQGAFTPVPEPSTRPARSPEQQKRAEAVEAILVKHGITDRAQKPEETKKAYYARLRDQVKDKRGFLLDLMQLQPPRAKKIEPPFELTNLKITGKTATGTLVQKEETGTTSVDISFDRVEGSWLISSVLIF